MKVALTAGMRAERLENMRVDSKGEMMESAMVEMRVEKKVLMMAGMMAVLLVLL